MFCFKAKVAPNPHIAEIITLLDRNDDTKVLRYIQNIRETSHVPIKYIKDEEGNNLLHIFVKHQKVELVRYILDTKLISATLQNRCSETPMDIINNLATNENLSEIGSSYNVLRNILHRSFIEDLSSRTIR